MHGIGKRSLRHLFMEDSTITEKDGRWLHELAVNNTVLESLNFYNTCIVDTVSIQDLEIIARNCPDLVSVKISTGCEILNLVNFFRYATSLEEFGGGSYFEEPENYAAISFPKKLNSLGLSFVKNDKLGIIFPYAAQLKKLDLRRSTLNSEDHCALIQICPNLEVLETMNVIGDRGLEVLAQCCRKLNRLKMESSRHAVVVSHRGLSALSHGCQELEYIAVYVTNITNAALAQIGTKLKRLCDFRLVLLGREKVADFPLDKGVRDLLRGCKKLRRFALCLRPGGLTDVGLRYIGKYILNVRWMLLGDVGETDAGLLEFYKGCPSLQKLEMMVCSSFSKHALATAAAKLTSLRYLWVQGYGGST